MYKFCFVSYSSFVYLFELKNNDSVLNFSAITPSVFNPIRVEIKPFLITCIHKYVYTLYLYTKLWMSTIWIVYAMLCFAVFYT